MKVEELASVFEAVRIMTLRPSDVLIFRANGKISIEHSKLIEGILLEKTGHGKILILDNTADIAVLRHEAEPLWFAKLKERLFG